MQAIFRFNESDEIEVWTSPGGVLLSQYRNLPIVESADNPHCGPRKEPVFSLGLSKSQARSIASAMMQAAAEL
jgi:hypothetical protein